MIAKLVDEVEASRTRPPGAEAQRRRLRPPWTRCETAPPAFATGCGGASGWRLDDGDIVWISPIGCLTHPNDIDRGGSDGDPYPPSLPNSTVAVQSGYGGKEDFCAQPPLSGRMSYDGTSGTAGLTIAIGELPPNSQVAVNWLNNSTRGYVVAAGASGSDGMPSGRRCAPSGRGSSAATNWCCRLLMPPTPHWARCHRVNRRRDRRLSAPPVSAGPQKSGLTVGSE